MSHTDPMILALRALGESAGTGHDDEHELTCVHCRHELARLSEVVDLARAAGPAEQLESPPPAVWDRIAAAVGIDSAFSTGNTPVAPAVDGTGPTAVNGTGPTAGFRPPAMAGVSDGQRETAADAALVRGIGARRAGMRWRRGRLAATVAGLAAGLIIGIGGTAGIVQLTRTPATHVVAQIELSPLPAFPQWNGVTGTAVMRAASSQQVMAVTLDAPQKPGFYEVWLLARNGVSMISLGDLDADHTGTFTIPPGVDLRTYSRIDISLQPFNGSTVHVKTSVVRGSLPAVAFGAGAGAGSASSS